MFRGQGFEDSSCYAFDGVKHNVQQLLKVLESNAQGRHDDHHIAKRPDDHPPLSRFLDDPYACLLFRGKGFFALPVRNQFNPRHESLLPHIAHVGQRGKPLQLLLQKGDLGLQCLQGSIALKMERLARAALQASGLPV